MKEIVIPLIIAVASAMGQQPNGDTLFQAMSDELARSVSLLKIEKHDKPYYVSYAINDTNNLEIDAAFGAVSRDQQNRYRSANVDVHVGNYDLDSGNMVRVTMWQGEDMRRLGLDDDYDALRNKLWLMTDSAYKRAVTNLERKKAILQEHNEKERAPDWSYEKPFVLIEPVKAFSPNRAEWRDRVKRLSAIFKQYPSIRQSSVSFTESEMMRYFVNNEGSKSRATETACVVRVSAVAQGKDGAMLRDTDLLADVDEQHLPSEDELALRVKQLAQRLTTAISAKEADVYQGPVLFEGEAAAEFFHRVLAPNVVLRKPPDDAKGSVPPPPRIGRRILPTFISVKDDPKLEDKRGTRLLGGSDVDLQGMPVEPVVLVEKGILKDLLSTRLPTLKVKNSNGHALSGSTSARISNLVVETAAPQDAASLKTKLMEYGKEDGLDYVLVVRKLSVYPTGHFGGIIEQDAYEDFDIGDDKIKLPLPIECVRVYLSDGHEEPIRSAPFMSRTMRIMRDIVATGDDARTYPTEGGATTVTAPSIIIRDVELQKPNFDKLKPPVLSHPYFSD